LKQLEVTILGQVYVLACPEGGETLIAAAVARVDQEMTAIRSAGKVKARERIAVLAALNLAFELSEAARPATSASASGTPSAPRASDDDDEQAALGALLTRLDQALGPDGQLL